jgi:carboxyl-terminal processing protease
MREADLLKHLENDKDAATKSAEKAAPEAAKAVPKAEPQAEQRAPIEPASAEDFQFQQALNHLKGRPVVKAPPVKQAAVTIK